MMFRSSHPSRALLVVALASLALPAAVLGQQNPAAAPAASAEPKKDLHKLRFICLSTLEKDQELQLASKDDKGAFLDLCKVGIRSSFVSDWLPAKTGELHLTTSDSGEPKSICRFVYPADAHRSLVVLIADHGKKTYNALVLDPDKLEFSKGSVLIVNFSSKPGMVALGTRKTKVASGDKTVVKPALEENGMYRMLVAYEGEDRKPVPCYDRYLQGNQDSRDLVFLIPDESVGLRVFSLPIFGAFN